MLKTKIRSCSKHMVSRLLSGDMVIWNRPAKLEDARIQRSNTTTPQQTFLYNLKEHGFCFFYHKENIFNLTELVFGTIKTKIRNSYTLSNAGKEGIARNEDKVLSIVKESCDKITKACLKWYFRERGEGRKFLRLYKN